MPGMAMMALTVWGGGVGDVSAVGDGHEWPTGGYHRARFHLPTLTPSPSAVLLSLRYLWIDSLYIV